MACWEMVRKWFADKPEINLFYKKLYRVCPISQRTIVADPVITPSCMVYSNQLAGGVNTVPSIVAKISILLRTGKINSRTNEQHNFLEVNPRLAVRLLSR